MFDLLLVLAAVYVLGVLLYAFLLAFVAAIYGEPLTYGALLKLAAQWPIHAWKYFRAG